MSKLSINQASKLFKVSRNTIYARIKKGDITKDSEGFVSAQDMVRLFGNKTDKKATEKAVIEIGMRLSGHVSKAWATSWPPGRA